MRMLVVAEAKLHEASQSDLSGCSTALFSPGQVFEEPEGSEGTGAGPSLQDSGITADTALFMELR
jgi:hypothetical protein